MAERRPLLLHFRNKRHGRYRPPNPATFNQLALFRSIARVFLSSDSSGLETWLIASKLGIMALLHQNLGLLAVCIAVTARNWLWPVSLSPATLGRIGS